MQVQDSELVQPAFPVLVQVSEQAALLEPAPEPEAQPVVSNPELPVVLLVLDRLLVAVDLDRPIKSPPQKK